MKQNQKWLEGGAPVRLFFFVVAVLVLTTVIFGLVVSVIIFLVTKHFFALLLAALAVLYIVSHWQQIQRDNAKAHWFKDILGIDLLAIVRSIIDFEEPTEREHPPREHPPVEKPEAEVRADNWWRDVRRDVIRFIEQGVTPIVLSAEVHHRATVVEPGQVVVSAAELENLRQAKAQLERVREAAGSSGTLNQSSG